MPLPYSQTRHGIKGASALLVGAKRGGDRLLPGKLLPRPLVPNEPVDRAEAPIEESVQ